MKPRLTIVAHVNVYTSGVHEHTIVIWGYRDGIDTAIFTPTHPFRGRVKRSVENLLYRCGANPIDRVLNLLQMPSVFRWKRWRHGAFFIIFLLLLVKVEVYGQTTVVAVRTSTEIVVGADSAGTAGAPGIPPHSMCKIGQVNDLLYAYAGTGEDTATGFNAALIAAQAARAPGAFSEKVQTFQHLIVQPLTVSLTLLHQVAPQIYNSITADGTPLEVIFFGMEKGLPEIFLVKCKASITPNGAIEVPTERSESIGTDPKIRSTLVLGHHIGIDAIMANSQNNLWKLGHKEAVRFLVTLEAVIEAPDVGPPIDLVQIDKTGIHWIERKPECEEKKALNPAKNSAPRHHLH